MRTSELPAGSVIKFKNPARVHLFYERYDYDKHWFMGGHSHGSMMTMDINPDDIVTILKTSSKGNHVGQTIFVQGSARVIYYQQGTFFDRNQGSLGIVDSTVGDYYYDVISP